MSVQTKVSTKNHVASVGNFLKTLSGRVEASDSGYYEMVKENERRLEALKQAKMQEFEREAQAKLAKEEEIAKEEQKRLKKILEEEKALLIQEEAYKILIKNAEDKGIELLDEEVEDDVIVLTYSIE